MAGRGGDGGERGRRNPKRSLLALYSEERAGLDGNKDRDQNSVLAH